MVHLRIRRTVAAAHDGVEPRGQLDEIEGLVPSSGTQYSPNARTIAHNRAIYAEQHEGDSAAQSGYGGATEGQQSK
ncbi:hypothetical protein [Candidatus Burkholderia verschuerenii]|uniref:hypothetical protein n=1 Tax=Candidatus Burkholderia verschuerenii TaxID=242163 RepID=UPI000ABEFBEB|nr:hypothetical protein [Candidatus Burkholderia verschuerenii]